MIADRESLYAAMTYEALVAATQGCTEHTCLYHGRANQELARRRKPRTENVPAAPGGRHMKQENA